MLLMRLALFLTPLVAVTLAAQHPARADAPPAPAVVQAPYRLPAALPHTAPSLPALPGTTFAGPAGPPLSPYRQIFWTQPPALTALQVRQRLAQQGTSLQAPPPLPAVEPALPSPRPLDKDKDKEMNSDRETPKQIAPSPGKS
jgi:hypothetical protein